MPRVLHHPDACHRALPKAAQQKEPDTRFACAKRRALS